MQRLKRWRFHLRVRALLFFDRPIKRVNRNGFAVGCEAPAVGFKGLNRTSGYRLLKGEQLQPFLGEASARRTRSQLQILTLANRKNVLPIYTEKLFMEKLNYIHQNPVRAGFVNRATDYRWSSARIWQGCPIENEPLLIDKDLIYWRRKRQ